MNKKVISAAVLLGLSSAATAVNVNTDGTGSLLLFPYFTMNDGKNTNIQIVNTTDEYKALKIRFNEGVNTWETRDFNIFMSPQDVWSAVITDDGTGAPILRTTDTTCTAPALKAGDGFTYVDFSTANIGATGHADPSTTLTAAQRIKEGHFEVFEMGVLDPADLVVGDAVSKTKHVGGIPGVQTGVPADCNAIRNLYKTTWASNPQVGVSAPTGGLFGEASIIDVADAREMGYSATAIQNFYTRPANSNPGTAFPNVTGLSTNGTSVASTQSNVIFGNQVWTTNWKTPLQALSAVMMAESVSNTFTVEDVIGAATDWVVTFPTKHSFVNPITISGSVNGNFSFGQAGYWGDPIFQTAAENPFVPGRFEVPMTLPTYDREETFAETELLFSPQAPGTTSSLLNEVNVLEFTDQRSVFGSALKQTVNTEHDSGWGALSFGNSSMEGVGADGSTHVFYGRPVIGFAATRVVNGSVAGTMKNYGAVYDHKYNRRIESK